MKTYVVWRWAKKTRRFIPRQNNSWGNQCNYGDYSHVVFAGMKPTDWMWIGRSRAGPLHKIVLNEDQAKRCVVAEQNPMPTNEELDAYPGGYYGYGADKYPKSFIPLTEYCGEHNVPEVLIPFEVKATPLFFLTFWLNFKARFIDRTLRVSPPIISE